MKPRLSEILAREIKCEYDETCVYFDTDDSHDPDLPSSLMAVVTAAANLSGGLLSIREWRALHTAVDNLRQRYTLR